MDQSEKKGLYGACFNTVWHCSLKCHQIFQEAHLLPQQELSTVLTLSVAICMVSIIANTSLVSETLRAILSDVAVNIHVFFL